MNRYNVSFENNDEIMMIIVGRQRYDITNKVTLEALLQKKLYEDEVKELLIKLCEKMQEIQNINAIITDLKYIFVDLRDYSIGFISLEEPLFSKQKNPGELIRNVVSQIRLADRNSNILLLNILNYINEEINIDMKHIISIVEKSDLAAQKGKLLESMDNNSTESNTTNSNAIDERVNGTGLEEKIQLNKTPNNNQKAQIDMSEPNQKSNNENSQNIVSKQGISKEQNEIANEQNKTQNQSLIRKQGLTQKQNISQKPVPVANNNVTQLAMINLESLDIPKRDGARNNKINYALDINRGQVGETTVLSSGELREEETRDKNVLNQYPRPYLIKKATNEKIDINKDIFRIGKSKNDMDYAISDNFAISRHHATITKKQGACFIEDNDSTNHTYVDEVILKPHEPKLLLHESRIVFANEEYEYRLR